MKEPMIWSYLIHLSTHISSDPSSPKHHLYAREYDENNNVSLEVWDEMMRFLAEENYNMVIIDLGDAVKYESHPEISAPDAWDKDFLKKKLDEMRALGLEPIPKLNFSNCHSTWLKEYRRLVSTPIYYKVCSELIAEVCELFESPRLFHLGLDEENLAMQSALPLVTIRQHDLYWHDVNFLFAECEKHSARPWIWADNFWDNPEAFTERMSRSVLQSNWYYHQINKVPKREGNRIAIEAYAKLDALGFEQVPTVSTYYRADGMNALHTLAHVKKNLHPELVKGFMTAPWFGTRPDFEFALKNDAYMLLRARKVFYPETL